MKNLILSPLSLILISLLSFINPSFGGKEDSLYTVEIDGRVLIPGNDESKFYQLELISDNTVLETGIVVDSESFLLRVKKNSLYTIRITKEGYSPMVVSLNTNTQNDKHNYRFDNSYFLSLHGFNMSLSLNNQEQVCSNH